MAKTNFRSIAEAFRAAKPVAGTTGNVRVNCDGHRVTVKGNVAVLSSAAAAKLITTNAEPVRFVAPTLREGVNKLSQDKTVSAADAAGIILLGATLSADGDTTDATPTLKVSADKAPPADNATASK